MKKQIKPHFALTAQRKVILEVIRCVTTHPTADEIYGMVRKRLPNISLGTVYRNLDKMSEQGLIKKIQISDTKKRFDGTVENHYHIRCSVCGKVEDLHGLRFMDLENLCEELQGYKIDGFRLELIGKCPQCLKKQKILRKNKGRSA